MKYSSIVISSALLFAACSADINPLLYSEFDTPHNLPPFEQIKNSHYVPAFEAAIEDLNHTIALIANQRTEATFSNTILPFDRAKDHLNRVESVFFNLIETNYSDTMNVMAETILPMLSKASDDISFNNKLFKRIKYVYDKRNEAGLDSIQCRVVELYYKDFVRDGALLNGHDKNRLAEINCRLSLLSLNYGKNLLAETNKFRLVIDTVADLAGLPSNIVESAAEKAKSLGLNGKWVFTLHNASIMPFLQNSENHELRKQLYDAYCKRGSNGGENDNRGIIREIVSLRIERAKLLGYKSHAHYVIEKNMAATPENVDSFLSSMWKPALQKAKQELLDMKNFAYKYNKTKTIEACDWSYWQEKLRKAQYSIEETELSKYYELNNVRNGVLNCASKLYGLSFNKVDDAPMYYSNDNELWQVFDVDGKSLGVVYFDWHPRDTKRGGAWCTTFRSPIDSPDGSHTEGQVSVVCNFTKGANGTPNLLTYDEVETVFHEFGHALQALFSKGIYRRTCGELARDYVEMPSQINERFGADTAIVRSFARHYETGEVIPEALLEKLHNTSTYGQGFASTEYLAASILDLRWHMLTSTDEVIDVDEFEKKVFEEIGLIDEIHPRYHSTYFSHIFNGGYEAGYYVYEYAEMIVSDAFAAFVENGNVFDRQLANIFRKHCLAEAGDGDLMDQYIKFRRQKPNMKYLMRHRGFIQEKKNHRAVKKTLVDKNK